jgi:hypothetical protein
MSMVLPSTPITDGVAPFRKELKMSTTSSKVSHGYKIESAETRMQIFEKNGTVQDVKNALDYLLNLLDNNPEFIEWEARDAYLSLTNAYRRRNEGLRGALVHVDWLIQTLEKSKETQVKWAVDALKEKLSQD